MQLEQKLEAILFYKNEPVSVKELSKILDCDEKRVQEAANKLEQSLTGRGITIIQTDTELALATSKESEFLIEKIAKDELSRDIGKAGLETLAIILYTGGVSRREIDYIRGVNSTFILRNLAMRGLVEREQDTKDGRGFRYKGSLNLLSHLGIKRASELPEFAAFKQKLDEAKVGETEADERTT